MSRRPILQSCKRGDSGEHSQQRNLTWHPCPTWTRVYCYGNARDFGGSNIFYNDDKATICCIAGTTGWGPTFAGRPTALWNPVIQVGDAAFGVHTNHYCFNIHGPKELRVVIEGATSLTSPVWTSLQTNTLSGGSLYFADPLGSGAAARFYRVRAQ